MQLSASRESWWLKLNQCKKKVCQTSLWGKEDSVCKLELTGAGWKSCFLKFKQKIKFCSFGVSAWEKSNVENWQSRLNKIFLFPVYFPPLGKLWWVGMLLPYWWGGKKGKIVRGLLQGVEAFCFLIYRKKKKDHFSAISQGRSYLKHS